MPQGRRPLTAVAFADGQAPFHDRRTWELILNFISDWRPDIILNLGDDADCYHWSHYNKTRVIVPPGHRANWNADSEIKEVHKKWDELKSAAPRAWRGYLEGNHEQRVRDFIQANASSAETKDTDFPSVFHVSDWWDFYGEDLRIGKLWFTHGTTCTVYAARAMLQCWGSSVVFGHTHRNVFWSHHLKNGDEHAAWGLPCHCLLSPLYVHRPDWSHGFAVIRFAPSGWFNVQVVPVIRHRFVFGDKLYGKE